MKNKPKRQNIAIDFDATIAQYPRFISLSDIPFPPVEGAKEALDTLSKYFRIVIFSVRANNEEGRLGIEAWMKQHEIPFNSITAEKPQAVLYIDDRAIGFRGNWKQTLKEIAEFQHYVKPKKTK